jgi:exoribonuclease R
VVTRLVRAPRIDFSTLRRELELPSHFPPAAQQEADAAAARVTAAVRNGPGTSAGSVRERRRADRTDIPFVTLDPAASRDLDQAMSLSRARSGYRVHYAIADVTAFVDPSGELEAETWRRGQTVYLPDGKVPLHPMSLSEGAASLLPGQTCPVALWTIDLDSDGATTAVTVERALVRSRAKLDYLTVQAAADDANLDGPIAVLPELGRLLIERGLHRGAISLPIPEQELESDGDGWRLILRAVAPAEEWNAQISLLTGVCAARIMLDGGLGLLRTMPAPSQRAIQRLRVAAASLGIQWPAGASVGRVIAAIDPASPRGAAFVDHAAELMRGAGYIAFDGTPPDDASHGAVGAPYAHVTAPLRRLADRYATEVCLSLVAGADAPDWARAALPRLPEAMATSDRRASTAERGAIDLAEATLLAGRVGDEFDAAVIDVDEPKSGPAQAQQPRPGGTIALDEPPVRARCYGTLPLGERVRVRLTKADPQRRSVTFELSATAG